MHTAPGPILSSQQAGGKGRHSTAQRGGNNGRQNGGPCVTVFGQFCSKHCLHLASELPREGSRELWGTILKRTEGNNGRNEATHVISGCLLGEVYAPCIHRMPGGVIRKRLGSLLLWACVQCVTSVVRAQLLTSHWVFFIGFLFIYIYIYIFIY